MDATERVETKAKLRELEAQLADIKAEKIRRLEALKAYQRENAIEFFKPHDKQLEAFGALLDPSKKTIGFQGGNRCLGGETRVYDPVTCESKRVDEIKEPFHVLAWNGSRPVVARASAPFVKGRDDLYEVILSSGHRFVCSMSHRVLCSDGRYRTLADVAVGDSLISGVSSPGTEFVPSAPATRDGNGSRTVQDSPAGCPVCHRCGDESPHPAAADDQDAAPSPDDVPARTSSVCSELSDAPGSTEIRSRTERCGHPTSRGCCAHRNRQKTETGCRESGTNAGQPICERQAGPQPNASSSRLSQSTGEAVERHSESVFASHDSFHVSTILTITYLRTDVKYDLTVPIYHNYWAGGCFHHNSGKTTWLITSIIALMRGYLPWDPDKKTRFQPPIRIRLFGEDMAHHIGQTLIPKLKQFYPKKYLQHIRRNNQGVEYFFSDVNGSTLEIMSYEQDTDSVESWSGHVVAYDEPPPRDKYIACCRGLVDNDGISLFSFTPLKEPWLHDSLVASGDPTVSFFFVKIDDNPYLSKEAIEQFAKTLTDEEKASRLEGHWLFLQGLVYSEFKRQTHVVKPMLKIPADYTVFAVLDTHPRAPHALSFFAVDEKNRVFQVDEKFSHGTPLEIADWMIEFHKHRHKITGCIIEPASKGDSNRGDSTFEIIDKAIGTHGIWLETGSRDLSGGILLVKEALCSRNGIASFFLCENCTRTLWEFERYVWDDWKQSGLKTEKQKPRDKDDHFMENLRRAITFPVEYANPKHLSNYLEQANRPYRPVDAVAGY